jgi:hypothetical protein
LNHFGCLEYNPERYRQAYDSIIVRIYNEWYKKYSGGSDEMPAEAKAVIRRMIPTPDVYQRDYYRVAYQLYTQKNEEKFGEYQDEKITSENYIRKIDELIQYFGLSNDDIIKQIDKNENNQYFYSNYSLSPKEYEEKYAEIKNYENYKNSNYYLPTIEEYTQEYYRAAVKALYEAKRLENEDLNSALKVFGLSINDGVITRLENDFDIFSNNEEKSISFYENIIFKNYLSENFEYLGKVYELGEEIGYELPTILMTMAISYGISDLPFSYRQGINDFIEFINNQHEIVENYQNGLSSGLDPMTAAMCCGVLTFSDIFLENVLDKSLKLNGDSTKLNTSKGALYTKQLIKEEAMDIQQKCCESLLYGDEIDFNELINEFGRDVVLNALFDIAAAKFANSEKVINITIDGKRQELSFEEAKILFINENSNMMKNIYALEFDEDGNIEMTPIKNPNFQI